MRRIRVPGDKSVTQRALIFASLASGESRLRGLLLGEDPQATAGALRALGVDIPPLIGDGAELRIQGVGLRGLREPPDVLDFANSGTGARLMLGVLAGQPMTVTTTGDASLRSRPMGRVTGPLSKMGAVFREMGEPDRLPLEVTGGGLDALDYDSPVASAQVKSALLLAGLVSGAFVLVSEPHRSRDHTERMLSMSGVSIISHQAGGDWRVELRDPPERIAPLDLEVPGDFSAAAFVLALAILGGIEGGVEIDHVGMNPTRRGLLDVLDRMGASVVADSFEEEDGGEPVTSLRGLPSTLVGTNVGGDEVPAMIDEFPVLAILAARAEGVTRITGAAELRVKESDRIRVLVENLRAVGVEAEELSDGLEIEGGDHPLAGRVSSHHDHRIAMAFGVLGALPSNQIEIDGADVADVSFPGFWGMLEDLTVVGSVTPRSNVLEGPTRRPVITLDGPAGSGKTSTAQAVAKRLGFRHLDSGALYRALTFALLKEGVPQREWGTLESEQLAELRVEVEAKGDGVNIYCDGVLLTSQLRSPEVTGCVSEVAGLPAVRNWLLGMQRSVGAHGNLVADGRDMGTVVFPDADVKIFLVAGLDERARRRLLQDSGREPTLGEIQEEAQRLEQRDKADRSRDHSPLRRPEDAVEVDTTGLLFDDQVALVLRRVKDLTPL